MLNGCHTSVQQLSVHANKSQANTYEKRLSSNVVQATASALQDLTIKFRKCQSAYLQSKWSFLTIIIDMIEYFYLELKSRKENFNRIMPDLDIDMHSNPFGDQNDPDKNFDQISVWKENIRNETIFSFRFLVSFGRSSTINYTKCWIFRKTW